MMKVYQRQKIINDFGEKSIFESKLLSTTSAAYIVRYDVMARYNWLLIVNNRCK